MTFCGTVILANDIPSLPSVVEPDELAVDPAVDPLAIEAVDVPNRFRGMGPTLGLLVPHEALVSEVDRLVDLLISQPIPDVPTL